MKLTISITLSLIAIQCINMLTGYALNQFGIVPRHGAGLLGIIVAPFLHGGWWHLMSNLFPLMILTGLITQQTRTPIRVLGVITVGTGAMVWLLGSNATHVGASGVVMGCWSYLLAYAWYHPSIRNGLIALIVFIFYGGLVWSLLDFRPHLSWSSHFYGCLVGIAVAKFSSVKHPTTST